MKPINPRPGVAVAITDRWGEIADYDPNAYKRMEFYRHEKLRKGKGDAEGQAANRERKDYCQMAGTG